MADPGGALRCLAEDRETGAAGGGIAVVCCLLAAEGVDWAVVWCALEVVVERVDIMRGVLLLLFAWPCESPIVIRVNSQRTPMDALL